MGRRFAWTSGFALALGLFVVTPAAAQQSINLSAGYFVVRGEDARVDGDVLVENRHLFLFDFNDFNSASLGIEWLVNLEGIGLKQLPAAHAPERYVEWLDQVRTPMRERRYTTLDVLVDF